MALVEQVMTMQPYASAKRVFWVVDNGSSHRGEAAIDRLAARFPNAVMVHTPVHASWLNQVEICFSVVQRKVVLPNDFTDLAEVKKRLAGFEKRYNQTARPFRWTFTRDDLHDLLARISQHEQQEARGTCAIVEMHPPVRQSDRTVGGDSDIQRGRSNPNDRHFGQVTARTRQHRHYAPSDRLLDIEGAMSGGLSFGGSEWVADQVAAVVEETVCAVVVEQVPDIAAVGRDDQFQMLATALASPSDAVRDEPTGQPTPPRRGHHEQVLQFGDQPVLQTETGGGDREAE